MFIYLFEVVYSGSLGALLAKVNCFPAVILTHASLHHNSVTSLEKMEEIEGQNLYAYF